MQPEWDRPVEGTFLTLSCGFGFAAGWRFLDVAAPGTGALRRGSEGKHEFHGLARIWGRPMGDRKIWDRKIQPEWDRPVGGTFLTLFCGFGFAAGWRFLDVAAPGTGAVRRNSVQS
jgi:hypothetical protein